MKKALIMKKQLRVMALTENERLRVRILDLEEEVRGYRQTLEQVHPIVMKHHSDLLAGLIDHLEEKSNEEQTGTISAVYGTEQVRE